MLRLSMLVHKNLKLDGNVKGKLHIMQFNCVDICLGPITLKQGNS